MNMVKTNHVAISDEPYRIVYFELKNNHYNNYINIYQGTWKPLNSMILRVKDPMNSVLRSYYYNLLYPTYIRDSALTSLKDSYT